MTERKTETAPKGTVGFTSPILTPHLEGIPEFAKPFEELTTKLQREFLTLWSNRAQAWIDWPGTFVACKTPTDLAQAQGEFLTSMQKHYATYCDCVFRDTLIEQDQLDEAANETPERDTGPVHKQAA